MKTIPALATLAVATLLSGPVAAIDAATLQSLAEKRLVGDRTGACFAVAVIEDTVTTARACADPAHVARIGPERAFEIGSVTKTMTAALLAKRVLAGEASLDDPLSAWLPDGTAVPSFDGTPILLRHVVTHTSGLPALPPGVPMPDPTNPYATLTPAQLHDAFGRTTLSRAPGTQFEYSNFALMLLSDALARRSGVPFDTLLARELFAPLAMEGAHVVAPPAGVVPAVGHLPNGKPTAAWDFPPDLAGVGGVRATLQDMVRYVEAHLDRRPTEVDAAFALTREPIAGAAKPPMGMGWMLAPIAGRTIHVHEGGTGGFSSFVAIDREAKRGVVILSDTAMTSAGGLGSLGRHLLDAGMPLGAPVREIPAPKELVAALAGEYTLANGMAMTVSDVDGALAVQAPGQPRFVLGHDDAGDFFPREFDALLRPQRQPGGGYGFTWMQGGGAVAATRKAAPAATAAPPADVGKLRGYAGDYPLLPGFALSVFERDGRLFVQGTGQQALPVEASGEDVFVMPAVGAEIRFERGDDGKVHALTLLQGGQTLRGERQ